MENFSLHEFWGTERNCKITFWKFLRHSTLLSQEIPEHCSTKKGSFWRFSAVILDGNEERRISFFLLVFCCSKGLRSRNESKYIDLHLKPYLISLYPCQYVFFWITRTVLFKDPFLWPIELFGEVINLTWRMTFNSDQNWQCLKSFWSQMQQKNTRLNDNPFLRQAKSYPLIRWPRPP